MLILDYISKNKDLKKYFEDIPKSEIIKHCKLFKYKFCFYFFSK